MTREETSEMLDKVINLIFMPWKLENATANPRLPRHLCLTMMEHFIGSMKDSTDFGDLYDEALEHVLLEYGQCMKIKIPRDDKDACGAQSYADYFLLFMILAAPLIPPQSPEETASMKDTVLSNFHSHGDPSGFVRAMNRYKDKATEFMTAVFTGADSVDRYINYSDVIDIKKDYASPAIARIVKVPMSPHALLPEPKEEPVKVVEAKGTAVNVADAQTAQPATLDEETRGKVLRAVFERFRSIIHNNQERKWGHLFHALVKAGLIDGNLLLSEYAKLVHRYNGVSEKTVRRHDDSFFCKTKDKDQWEDTVNWMYEKTLEIKEEVCSSSKAA